MKNSTRAFVCLIVLALFIAVACQPAPTPSATPTAAPTPSPTPRATPTPVGPVVRIAVAAALTGEQRDLGEAIRNAAQLAVKQSGKPIQDAGYNLVVAPYDDQARADTGVSNAKKIAGDPEVMVVIGHLNSNVTLAALDSYKDAHLAVISPANTDPKLSLRGVANFNRVIGRDDLQGPSAAELAAKELKAKAVFVIADKTTFGAATAQAFRARATTLGLNIVGYETAPDGGNYDALINAITAAKPDLIYFSGAYNPAAAFLKSARAKNVKAIFLAPETIDFAEFARLAGDDAVGVYYGTPVGQVDDYPDAAKFARDYRAEFNKAAEVYAAQAYDAAGLAIQAIAGTLKSGSKPTRQAVAEAIRATKNYKGVTGNLSFDANGDLTTAKYFFFQVTSADPQKWLENKLFKTLELAPTLP